MSYVENAFMCISSCRIDWRLMDSESFARFKHTLNKTYTLYTDTE